MFYHSILDTLNYISHVQYGVKHKTKKVGKNFTTMELRAIFEQLLGPGGPFERNQIGLAAALGISQSTVSAIKSGRPELEEHWQLFRKVLPLCARMGCLPAVLPSDILPPPVKLRKVDKEMLRDLGIATELLGEEVTAHELVPKLLEAISHAKTTKRTAGKTRPATSGPTGVKPSRS